MLACQRAGRGKIECLREKFRFSLFLGPTDCLEILDIVYSLKIRSSSGHDEISSTLLKQIIGSILTPLMHICNFPIIWTGLFPSSFKLAKVIPVHRRDSTSAIPNYRPMSILSNFSKVLEWNVYNRLISFLGSNKFLNPNQFGLRRSHSTDLTL